MSQYFSVLYVKITYIYFTKTTKYLFLGYIFLPYSYNFFHKISKSLIDNITLDIKPTLNATFTKQIKNIDSASKEKYVLQFYYESKDMFNKDAKNLQCRKLTLKRKAILPVLLPISSGCTGCTLLVQLESASTANFIYKVAMAVAVLIFKKIQLCFIIESLMIKVKPKKNCVVIMIQCSFDMISLKIVHKVFL